MEIEEETESGRDWRSIGDRLQTALRGGYLRCAQTRGTDFHHEIRPSSCFAPAIFLLRPCLSWPTSSSLPPFRWVAFPKQGNNSLRRGAKLCSGHAVSVPRAKLCSGPSICMLRVSRMIALAGGEKCCGRKRLAEWMSEGVHKQLPLYIGTSSGGVLRIMEKGRNDEAKRAE